MAQKHRNNERGFTLIELMVILLVAGILAAIAIPLYIRSRPKTTGVDAIGGVKTYQDSFDAGVDPYAASSPEPSASPPPSPGPSEAPDVPRATIMRSTDAPSALGPSTPTPAPAGVEPPHVGPPDSG